MSTTRARVREAAVPGRDEAQRQSFLAIGAFLAEHRLAPTPANYALAYAVVTEADG